MHRGTLCLLTSRVLQYNVQESQGAGKFGAWPVCQGTGKIHCAKIPHETAGHICCTPHNMKQQILLCKRILSLSPLTLNLGIALQTSI